MQSFTASKMAFEVTEAPETASTPSVPLALTMASGSCSMALEPMPSVSEFSPTSTLAILPSLTVTVTSTSPPMPLAEALYSPSAMVVAAAVSVPPLAWFRQSSTAVKMAFEVTEAPETASTPSVPLALTMASGSCSMALEPMPSVSEFSPTSTLAILPSLTVTVTGTSPPMPLEEALYSPSLSVAAAASLVSAAFSSALASLVSVVAAFSSALVSVVAALSAVSVAAALSVVVSA